MRIILYLLLFLSIICEDIREVTKFLQECFQKKLGRQGYLALYEKYIIYYTWHARISFPDYIIFKEPELHPLYDECMEEKKKYKNLALYSVSKLKKK